MYDQVSTKQSEKQSELWQVLDNLSCQIDLVQEGIGAFNSRVDTICSFSEMNLVSTMEKNLPPVPPAIPNTFADRLRSEIQRLSILNERLMRINEHLQKII